MTVKFTGYGGRTDVVALLEAPIRALPNWDGDKNSEASQDIFTILAELDRIDEVIAARQRVNAADWRRRQDARDDVLKAWGPSEGKTCPTLRMKREGKWGPLQRVSCAAPAKLGTYCLRHGPKIFEHEATTLYLSREAEREEATPDEMALLADKALRQERRKAGR